MDESEFSGGDVGSVDDSAIPEAGASSVDNPGIREGDASVDDREVGVATWLLVRGV